MKYGDKEIMISKTKRGNYMLETDEGFVISDNCDPRTLDKVVNLTKGEK